MGSGQFLKFAFSKVSSHFLSNLFCNHSFFVTFHPFANSRLRWMGRDLFISLTCHQLKVEPAGVGVVVEAGHMCMVKILHFYLLFKACHMVSFFPEK